MIRLQSKSNETITLDTGTDELLCQLKIEIATL